MSEPTCMTFREVGLTCGGWNSLAVRLAEAEARLAEAEREQDDMHRVRLLLYAERDALKARLAEAEALLEIVAPLAYAQWKSGSCGSVEAVVGLNEPITGIADSATGATNAKP